MSAKITYAKGGETPGGEFLEVFNLDTGEKIDDVAEVNCDEGWLVRYRHDEDGNLIPNWDKGECETEKLTGRFEIRPMAS